MKKNLLGIIIFICVLFIPTMAFADTVNDKVHFISSQNGDSMIIESNGHYGLVDALSETESSKVIQYATALGVQKFDFVIMTHHHADNIGGIPALADFFDSNTIVFYKEDLLASDDYEESTLHNNTLYQAAINVFNNKSSKTCDVTKAYLGTDSTCNLSTLSNNAISSVTYDPVTMTPQEAAAADDNYPYSTQYATKVRENLSFKFGDYTITLYSLYNVSYHHENLNSIVTLISYDYTYIEPAVEEGEEDKEVEATFNTLLTGDIETARGDFDYSSTSSSPNQITDPTGTCRWCRELGLDNQISDIIGPVDLLKAANHGSNDSNSIYSIDNYLPSYYIIEGGAASGEPYGNNVIPITYLKALNETKTYLASDATGALVLELRSNAVATIKQYGTNATSSGNPTDISESTNFMTGWKQLNNLKVGDIVLGYVENGEIVLDQWKDVIKNSVEHRYHFNEVGLVDTGFYVDILVDISAMLAGNEGNEGGTEIISIAEIIASLDFGEDYKVYYLCEDNSCLGEMQTGLKTIDNYTYYFRTVADEISTGNKGEMVIGLAEITTAGSDNGTYYFRKEDDEVFAGPQGSALKNGCVTVNVSGTDTYMCFGPDGKLTNDPISVPVPTNAMCNSAVYNDELQSITDTPNGGYHWKERDENNHPEESNMQKNVGTYQVKAILNNDNVNQRYVWADGSTSDTEKTITCSMAKAQFETPKLRYTGYDYSEEEIEPEFYASIEKDDDDNDIYVEWSVPEWGYNKVTKNSNNQVVEHPINVGQYTTTISLKNTSNMEWINDDGTTSTDPFNFTWGIVEGERPTVPSVSSPTVIYDGQPHSVGVSSTEQNVSFEYAEDENGPWRDEPYTITNVGYKTMYVRIKADSQYNASAAVEGTITIVPKTMVKPTLTGNSFVYSGETKTPTINNYDSSLMTITGSTSATNVGTYPIVINLRDTTNYIWSDNTTTAVELSWSITKATKDQPSVSSYEAEYDGQPHSVTINSADPVEYSLDGLAWSDTVPTQTVVGVKTVHIRAKGDNNHNPSLAVNAVINITARKIIKPTLSPTSFDYTGSSKTPTINGYDSSLMDVSGTTNATNVGQYTITISLIDSTNNIWSDDSTDDVTLTWEIIKDIYPSPVVSSYSGKYDGQPHSVLVSGEGTIKYSTDNSTWVDILPTRTDVGTTTVYVKRLGDSNYSDSYVVQGTITITKANITAPTVTSYNGNYDGSAHTITVSTVPGGTIKYSTDNVIWSTTKPTRSSVGTTIVYVKVFGDSNHNDSLTVSGTITINEDTTYEIKNYTVDESKKYINKIIVGTDLETFKSNIILGSEYSVVVDTKTVNGKKLLYTGGKTKIMHGTTVVKEYTNIVIGDTNGDGLTNSADLLRLRQHLLGTKLLTGVYFIASDINYDNIINSADLLRVRQHLLGTKLIG